MLSIFGNLISKFGLSKVVASTIVGLLSTGASYSVMVLCPIFIDINVGFISYCWDYRGIHMINKKGIKLTFLVAFTIFSILGLYLGFRGATTIFSSIDSENITSSTKIIQPLESTP